MWFEEPWKVSDFWFWMFSYKISKCTRCKHFLSELEKYNMISKLIALSSIISYWIFGNEKLSAIEKVVESCLRWLGYVWRKPVETRVRRVDQIKDRSIDRGRGKPKKSLCQIIKKNSVVNEPSLILIHDRTLWRHMIHVADSTYWGKA